MIGLTHPESSTARPGVVGRTGKTTLGRRVSGERNPPELPELLEMWGQVAVAALAGGVEYARVTVREGLTHHWLPAEEAE